LNIKNVLFRNNIHKSSSTFSSKTYLNWEFLRTYTNTVLLIIFFADHRATVFTLSKTFETAQKKSCAAFLPIFVMKSGARTIKHIYFVSLDIYLHSSILTYIYLLIFNRKHVFGLVTFYRICFRRFYIRRNESLDLLGIYFSINNLNK
jgi:hypothetical protein